MSDFIFLCEGHACKPGLCRGWSKCDPNTRAMRRVHDHAVADARLSHHHRWKTACEVRSMTSMSDYINRLCATCDHERWTAMLDSCVCDLQLPQRHQVDAGCAHYVAAPTLEDITMIAIDPHAFVLGNDGHLKPKKETAAPNAPTVGPSVNIPHALDIGAESGDGKAAAGSDIDHNKYTVWKDDPVCECGHPIDDNDQEICDECKGTGGEWLIPEEAKN